MLVRTLLTIVNFAIFGVTIGVVLAFPAYDTVAFYFLLGWMVASFALFYLPFAGRRVGGGGPAPPPGGSTFGPGPLDPGATAAPAGRPLASSLGFCIYCAAPLPGGATTCPACGHAVPQS
ncbi:MAG TPA: hypothetical protein VMG99_06620 [Thermoplasmata archaeon]|jgi:hypothetical protein|nr:hypothetical protein [Thermoplasmata archaeon]